MFLGYSISALLFVRRYHTETFYQTITGYGHTIAYASQWEWDATRKGAPFCVSDTCNGHQILMYQIN